MTRFPTVDVARRRAGRRRPARVAGLGYNRRALNLQRAAQAIVERARRPGAGHGRGARGVAGRRSVHRASRGRDRVRAPGGSRRHERAPRARAGRGAGDPAPLPAAELQALADAVVPRRASRRLDARADGRRRARSAGRGRRAATPVRRSRGAGSRRETGRPRRGARAGRRDAREPAFPEHLPLAPRPDRRAGKATRPTAPGSRSTARSALTIGTRSATRSRRSPARACSRSARRRTGLRRDCPPDPRGAVPSRRAHRDPCPCPRTTRRCSALSARRARAAVGRRRHAGRRSRRETMTGLDRKAQARGHPGRDADGARRHRGRRGGAGPRRAQRPAGPAGADPGRARQQRRRRVRRGAPPRRLGHPVDRRPGGRRGAARDPRRGARTGSASTGSTASRACTRPSRATSRILGQGIDKAGVVVDALLGHRRPRPAPRARSERRSSVIGRARAAGVPVLAVDTPDGRRPDVGRPVATRSSARTSR